MTHRNSMAAKAAGLALALTATLIATPAAAQFGGPDIDANTPVVEELVVRAYGGPPWWKVSDADTTVYILASPGPLPAGFSFDQKLLDKRLTGANSLILPPTAKLGFTALFAAPQVLHLMNLVNKNKKTNLEPSLPPAVRARFAAARGKAGQPETRYGALPPGLAGIALAGDLDRTRQKETPADASPPGTTVEAIVEAAARKKNVRAAPAKVYGGPGLIGEFMRDLQKPGMTCLTSTLDMIDAPAKVAKPSVDREQIASAWADGDIRPMVEAARKTDGFTTANVNFEIGKSTLFLKIGTPQCLDGVPVIGRITTAWPGDQTAAIVAALRKPGHSVAVVEAGSLLIKGGVLDRLKRAGYTVTLPNVE